VAGSSRKSEKKAQKYTKASPRRKKMTESRWLGEWVKEVQEEKSSGMLEYSVSEAEGSGSLD
jgi:hypothetical protein